MNQTFTDETFTCFDIYLFVCLPDDYEATHDCVFADISEGLEARPKGLSSLTGFYWQFQIQTWENAQQQNIVFLFWFVMQVKT